MYCVKRSTALARRAYHEYCVMGGKDAISKSLRIAEQEDGCFYSNAELVVAEVKLKQMVLTGQVVMRRMRFMKRSNLATLI